MSNKPFVSVGVDLAKGKFDVHLLGARKALSRTFFNNAHGIRAFEAWMLGQGLVREDSRVCMEATGRYGEALCRRLHASGWTLHVVNPARIAYFAKSLGRRSKTDTLDAESIALFCSANLSALSPWKPMDPRVATLRDLLRRRAQLRVMATAEKNVISAFTDEADATLVRLSSAHLEFIEAQIAEIDAAMEALVGSDGTLRAHVRHLRSIKGVGVLTAFELLAHVLSHDFTKARQCAAHAGLTPSHRQSGTSVNGRPHISRCGDAHIRRALYMPALSMLRAQGHLKDWARSLIARGKPPKAALCAMMRKLIHVAYGIVKSGRDYDPAVAFPASPV